MVSIKILSCFFWSGIVGCAYVKLFDIIWKEIDDKFRAAFVLGVRGKAFVETWAIKAAHPLFAFALAFLATMAGLVNGAKAKLFPNSASPLFAFFLNINFSQTRKSSITGVVDQIGEHLDACVMQRIDGRYDEAMQDLDDERAAAAQGAGGAGPEDDMPALVHEGQGGRGRGMGRGRGRGVRRRARQGHPPRPVVVSSILHSSTAEAFFERASGDFKQVANSDKPGLEFLAGRHEYGNLISVDEAYDFCTVFGYIGDDAAGGRKGVPRVNPHQSSMNKLAQYGLAARATKTSGAYGDGLPPNTSTGFLGNMHPAAYIPMEKELTGSHVAQGKERFLVGTGRPVQPHADIPSDYTLPTGVQRWKWVPLVPEVASALGISEQSVSPESAAKAWGGQHVKVDTNVDAQYVPNEVGYEVVLPDETVSRVRFHRDEASPNGFKPEWRISNRSFTPDEKYNLKDAVNRLNDYFKDSHKEIAFTADAVKLHESYMGGFNVQCHRQRATGDVQTAARLGVGPWLLGMVASLLLVFEIFVGEYEHMPPDTDEQKQLRELYVEKDLKVTEQHVQRAYNVITVVYRIKELCIAGLPAAQTMTMSEEQRATAQHIEQERKAADALQATIPAPGIWSNATFTWHQGTQPVSMDFDNADGQQAAEPARDDEDEEAELGGVVVAPPENVLTPVVPLTPEDVRGTSYGYGPEGKSVQTELLTPQWTDRAVMKKTLLQGVPRIFGQGVCNIIRTRIGGSNKALQKGNWEKVMEAGLRECSVAKLQGQGTMDAAVVLKDMPEDADSRIVYNNELMKLCGVSLRELTTAMQEKTAKDRSRSPRIHRLPSAGKRDARRRPATSQEAGPEQPGASLSSRASGVSPASGEPPEHVANRNAGQGQDPNTVSGELLAHAVTVTGGAGIKWDFDARGRIYIQSFTEAADVEKFKDLSPGMYLYQIAEAKVLGVNKEDVVNIYKEMRGGSLARLVFLPLAWGSGQSAPEACAAEDDDLLVASPSAGVVP